MTKWLHWVTVLALVVQFVVGYVMDPDDGDGDLLWLHVTAHVLFFVALAVHVGMAVTKRLSPRIL